MRRCSISLGILTSVVFSNAYADSDVALVEEIRKTCAGVVQQLQAGKDVRANVGQFGIDIKNNENIFVYREGVLLEKVTKFEAADYLSCVQSLSAIFKGVTPKAAVPPEILSDVAMGQTGSASLAYLKALLGTPRSDQSGYAEFVVGGYRIEAEYQPADTNDEDNATIVAIAIHLDETKRAVQRDKVKFAGYWAPCSFLDSNPDVCVPDVNPDAELGVSTIRDFMVACEGYDFFGGLATNTDPELYCTITPNGANNFVTQLYYVRDSLADISSHIMMKRYYIFREEQLRRQAAGEPYDDDAVHEATGIYQFDYYSSTDVREGMEVEMGLNGTIPQKLAQVEKAIEALFADAVVIGIELRSADAPDKDRY